MGTNPFFTRVWLVLSREIPISGRRHTDIHIQRQHAMNTEGGKEENTRERGRNAHERRRDAYERKKRSLGETRARNGENAHERGKDAHELKKNGQRKEKTRNTRLHLHSPGSSHTESGTGIHTY